MSSLVLYHIHDGVGVYTNVFPFVVAPFFFPESALFHWSPAPRPPPLFWKTHRRPCIMLLGSDADVFLSWPLKSFSSLRHWWTCWHNWHSWHSLYVQCTSFQPLPPSTCGNPHIYSCINYTTLAVYQKLFRRFSTFQTPLYKTQLSSLNIST